MGLGDIHGFAKVDTRSPRAFAICDLCGLIYNRVDLVALQEWTGNQLIDLGFLVCKRTCLDKPQEQFRTPVLPISPKPIINPRVEFFDKARGNFGFTLLTLQPAILTTDSNAKVQVLNSIAATAGISFPSPLTDFSGTLAAAVTTQSLVAAKAGRIFILVYNPTNMPMIVSTGQAAFAGDPSAILIGPGNGLLWATAQNLGVPYQGALTGAGYLAGQNFYGWQA